MIKTKNIVIEKNTCTFGELKVGDYFLEESDLYIKSYMYEDGERYDIDVNLRSGETQYRNNDTVVIPVNVDIRAY